MEDSTHTNGAGSCRQGRAASRLTPGINIRAWLGSIPGLQPDGKRDRHPDSPRNPNPNRGCTAGVCLRARRETMRPAPSPRALSTPSCAALGCPLLPRDVPCNLGSLRLRAAHSPAPDWSLQKCLGRQPSDTGLAAPESCSSAHFPGSFDHAPTGSSGALEQTEGVPVRAAAAGGKAGWVEWAAERWHGSMPRVAGVPGRPGPSVLPPDSLSPPEHPRAVRPTSRSPLLVRILGAA